jgi:ethanolamine utilization protein EutA (predicted chaperonin)
LVCRSPQGGCLQIRVGSHDAQAVAALGGKIARSLAAAAIPPDRPLVLLVVENVGKALGGYVTAWGASPRKIAVIDEVAPRDAQVVRIGAPRGPVVPVSFYGLNGQGDE